MVLRPSSSSWSVCPEAIMSHHYRLTKGVRSVVDTSPPFSMYNSPISIHYVPKRASSADAIRRNANWISRPHLELSAFIQSHSSSLRLPLPLQSGRNDGIKSKLLSNRNYQPPRKEKKDMPPLPVPSANPKPPRRQARSKIDNSWLNFKDTVYSSIISRGVYTDRIIVDTVESEMERWIGIIPWAQLELLRDEIYEEFDVKTMEVKKTPYHRESSAASLSGSTSVSSSSSSNKSRSSSSSGKNQSSELSELSSNATSSRASFSDSDD